VHNGNVRPLAGRLSLPPLDRKTIVAIVLAVVSVGVIAALPDALGTAGKIALGTFALTVVGWTLTKLNDTFVALFAAAGLVLSATITTENFFASLGNSVVWLMIGAFIVAAALNKSGASARLTALAARRAGTVEQLFYLLTAVLLFTALLIPSTSARAALMCRSTPRWRPPSTTRASTARSRSCCRSTSCRARWPRWWAPARTW
jgi:solute carrier family 13 (sodium-dependent dicarboxylate transporter), member 2/3/5